MYDSIYSHVSSVWFKFVLITGFFTFVAIKTWQHRRRVVRDSFKIGSVLLAHYATSSMLSLKEGPLRDGAYFNAITTGNKLLYTVQLPFQTELHILALAHSSGMDEGLVGSALRSGVMTEVVLEGDFPNYFHLYTSPGQEARTRYILDPEAMGNVIDFCRTNSWELLNDELYVIMTPDSKKVVTLSEIEAFIAQIRPVVADASTVLHHQHRMSKKQASLQLKVKCPLCQAPLIHKSDWYECPHGHGYLLTGQELVKMRRKQLTVPDEHTPDVHVPHPAIACPVCAVQMVPIPYVYGQTIIDSCQNCQYRWLDGGEQHQLAAQE